MSGRVYTIEVLPSVDLDVAEHRAFLDTCRVGLGDRLESEIRAVFAQLRDNPRIFQRRYGEFRMVQTKRLRYKVIYRIVPESIVQVAAVRHPRQHPTAWKR